jgi:2-methylcitrate dehydratase PrpD
MLERLHAGGAAEAGVTAAALAERGFTGPPNALEGSFGLLDVVGGTAADSARLDAALGESFALMQVWTKMYPCCAAVAIGNDPKDPAHYDEANLAVADVRALIDRIELFIDPKMQAISPHSFGASVTIELRDGTTLATEVSDPRGTAVAPCDPAELDRKFLLLARAVPGLGCRTVAARRA